MQSRYYITWLKCLRNKARKKNREKERGMIPNKVAKEGLLEMTVRKPAGRKEIS